MVRIPQLRCICIEVQIDRLIRPAAENDGIIAGAFEFGREQSYTAASSNMMACSDSGGALFFVGDAFRQVSEIIE